MGLIRGTLASDFFKNNFVNLESTAIIITCGVFLQHHLTSSVFKKKIKECYGISVGNLKDIVIIVRRKIHTER